MERGAFSDDEVVKAASKGVVSILVDCDWGRKNRKVSEAYGVRGYPTILFVDSDGNGLEKGSRDPKKLAAQFEKHAAAAGGE